jgi:hypothetical protein
VASHPTRLKLRKMENTAKKSKKRLQELKIRPRKALEKL